MQKIDLTSTDSIMGSISVLKKDVKNPESIRTLEALCRNIKSRGYDKNNTRKLLQARIDLLEKIAEIYIEEDDDELLELIIEDIEFLKNIT